jgi:DNA-binding transcriptional LysR family regulator
VVDVELRHLRYFVAIAEERSFTGAAERLWIAQPGLSAQMRRLEDELGVQLLERHSRGVRLTPAGELFLERARVALAASDTAAATGRDLEAGIVGTLRVGVAGAAVWPLASTFLQRFNRERPGIELSVLQAYSASLWRDLRDGRLDALLTPAGSVPAGMRVLDLGSAEWVALIGTGHPLAGIGPLPAAQLDGERIAVTGHRDGAAFDAAVANLLGELGVSAELVSGAPWPAAHAAVTGNDLVGLTTAPHALPAGVLARPLEPRRTLSFELLWRDEEPSPALAGLVDAAAAQVEVRPSGLRLAAVA